MDMPLIECTAGAVQTKVGEITYTFSHDRQGRAVAEVDNLTHRSILLGLDLYREVPKTEEPDQEPEASTDDDQASASKTAEGDGDGDKDDAEKSKEETKEGEGEKATPVTDAEAEKSAPKRRGRPPKTAD